MNKNRTCRIDLRVSENEKKAIEQKAEEAGADSISTYLRKLARDGKIIKINTPKMDEILCQLHRIGINMNQIAKWVNTTDNIKSEYVENILDSNQKLNAIVSELIEEMHKLFEQY